MADSGVLRERLNPPMQARSRETMERILAAAERLLGERDLHELTVGEIVDEAGSSVGAFYQRFANKDALLPVLVARYYEQGASVLGDLAAAGRWDGRPLAERVEAIFRAAVRVSRERRGLFRAMAMQRRSPAPSSDLENALGAQRMFSVFTGMLLECRDEMGCADPERRVTLGLSCAMLLLQEKLYFPASPFAVMNDLDDEGLVVGLTAVVLASVGAVAKGD